MLILETRGLEEKAFQERIRTKRKSLGRKRGPKFILTPEQRKEVMDLTDKGWTARELAQAFGVSKQTIWAYVKTEREAQEFLASGV